MSMGRGIFKRVFDVCFSSCVLICGAPLFLAISLTIRLSSPGPAFYASMRMGKGGKLIRCWKFRSMCLNADEKIEELIAKDPQLKEEWETYAKLKNDPRITPIGKWLRKTSLDELPQFWNVLKGDLSLVGPRPFLVQEVRSSLKDKAEKILSVRPGLTGIWQTSGRNKLTFLQRVSLEEAYVEKQSFALDLLLICKTIPIMLFARGL